MRVLNVCGGDKSKIEESDESHLSWAGGSEKRGEKGRKHLFHQPAKSSDVALAKTNNVHTYVRTYVELTTCDRI